MDGHITKAATMKNGMLVLPATPARHDDEDGRAHWHESLNIPFPFFSPRLTNRLNMRKANRNPRGTCWKMARHEYTLVLILDQPPGVISFPCKIHPCS
jgi:hypothetical protein